MQNRRTVVIFTSILIGTMLTGFAMSSTVFQSALADTGFTVVKKTTGVIMKFCINEAFTLQDCKERYEGLGWTDRINVLIYAPGWNEDSNKIDVIGTSTNPITVSTGSNRVTEVDFSETGPDTGIFMGVVKMTGAPGHLVHDTYYSTIFSHGVTGSTENGAPAHGHTGHGGHTAHDTTQDMQADNTADAHSGHMQADNTADAHSGHMQADNTADAHSGHMQADNTADAHSGHMQADNTADAHSGHMQADNTADAHSGHTTHQERSTGSEISSHDRAVLIATEPQGGGITVTWEPNEDVIIQRSASYVWQIGEIMFDKPSYTVDEKVKFHLRDADLWIHHSEFHTNYVNVYSDSDRAGIYVGVQFTPNMEHATVQDGFSNMHLTEPAASSLTKYTEDGRWKVYFWWEPGGLLGVDQDYLINLMAHDGMTDVHEMGLSYTMEIYLNGELVETRKDRFFTDGQGLEPIRFDERGSVRIIIKDIFNDVSQQVNFSFQVAPEAVIKEVVPRHSTFEKGNIPKYLEGYEHPHHYNYLSGEFIMTTTDISHNQDRLRVSPGDTIYISYDDITLPKPYTTADQLKIVDKALVVDSRLILGDNSEVYVEAHLQE